MSSPPREPLARAIREWPGGDRLFRPGRSDLGETQLGAADEVVAKLARVGYELAEPSDRRPEAALTQTDLERLAELEHERWCEEKLALGYRLHPGQADDAVRTHPSLVPYLRLTEDEKEKDRVRVVQIPRLVRAAGLKIVRPGAR